MNGLPDDSRIESASVPHLSLPVREPDRVGASKLPGQHQWDSDTCLCSLGCGDRIVFAERY